jgi:hypothetical protein
MRVHKTTFEENLKQKEEAFLRLTGPERLKLMRMVSEREHKSEVNYELRSQKVRIQRLP